MKSLHALLSGWVLALALLASAAQAQDAAPAPFKAEELEALVAPIALYPDSLLAQVLMASTYPLEVVQAARWAKANPGVSGDAALKKVENETWDVSVKSLTAFPNILEMMNEKLDWTQKLGDAFIGQQKDVLDAVQRMRQLAKKNGNLESNPQQVVKTEAQTIIIEPAQPQTIYVPAYNPTVVYGAWPYPAYPPYYYPGVALWYPGQALVRGFAWGVGFAAAGAIFGGCNWRGGSVNVNVNRAVNIDRNYSRNSINTGGNWQHNPQHRGNTPYRDKASQDRFGDKRADSARQDFRGRENTGGDRGGRDGGSREGIGSGDRGGRDGASGDRGGRDGVGGDRGGDRGGRDGAGGGRDGVGGDWGGHSGGDRAGLSDRGSRSGSEGAFAGANQGSRDADRGRASTSQMNRDSGARAPSGGSRQASGGGSSRSFSGGGGGGARGGGGRGGGGGRR
jgi:hypothetical protein